MVSGEGCILTWQNGKKRDQPIHQTPLQGYLTSFIMEEPSWPNHLLKAPTLNTTMLATPEFWRAHIQTIVVTKILIFLLYYIFFMPQGKVSIFLLNKS